MEKKGQILIRFPDAIANQLRVYSNELNVPINEIVSSIVKDNLDIWAAKKTMQLAKNFAAIVAKGNYDGRNDPDDPSGKKRISRMDEKLEEIMNLFIHLPSPSSPQGRASRVRKPSKPGKQ